MSKDEHAKKYEEALKKMRALVVGDCLDGRFEALESKELPMALLPVANVPHIRYTIEFLLMN